MSDLFRIRGGDFREYGPAAAPQVLDWIRHGRADRSTPARNEDSPTWRRLADYPEFAAALPPVRPQGRPIPGGPPSPTLPSLDDLRTRSVSLSVLDSFVKGWQLLTRQSAPLLGAGALVTGLILVLLPLSFVPFAFLLTLPAALILSGPLAGGLSGIAVRAWRGHRVRVRELFLPFRSSFRPLSVAYLALVLCTFIAFSVGAGVVGLGISAGTQASDLTLGAGALIVTGAVLTPFLALIPSALWGFTAPLIMDRGMGPLDALRLSRQIALRHPVRSLLLSAGGAILLFAGLLLGGVGLFFTLPWVVAARACAYDELFGPRHAPPG